MAAPQLFRTAQAKRKIPSLPISRWRPTPDKLRLVRSRAPIALPNTTNCFASKRTCMERHASPAVPLFRFKQTMNLADVRHLFDYTEWANGLSLDAAAKLSDEDLRRNVNISHASILERSCTWPAPNGFGWNDGTADHRLVKKPGRFGKQIPVRTSQRWLSGGANSSNDVLLLSANSMKRDLALSFPLFFSVAIPI